MHWRAPNNQHPARFPSAKSFALFGVDPYIEVLIACLYGVSIIQQHVHYSVYTLAITLHVYV